MGLQDDWILRQIEIVARFVSQLVFHKNDVRYELSTTTETLSSTDETYLLLTRLLKEKRVGEAEDLLFENIEYNDRYIQLAMDFYSKLNTFSDQELEDANFSREEVYDGLIEILELLGVPIEQFK